VWAPDLLLIAYGADVHRLPMGGGHGPYHLQQRRATAACALSHTVQ
jgi:hypothetical protein